MQVHYCAMIFYGKVVLNVKNALKVYNYGNESLSYVTVF